MLNLTFSRSKKLNFDLDYKYSIIRRELKVKNQIDSMGLIRYLSKGLAKEPQRRGPVSSPSEGSTGSKTSTSSSVTPNSTTAKDKDLYDNVLPSHRCVMLPCDALEKFDVNEKHGAGDDEIATRNQKQYLDPSAARSKHGGRSKNKSFRRKGRAPLQRSNRTTLLDTSGRSRLYFLIN